MDITMFRTRLLLVGFLLISLILLMGGVSEWAAGQFRYHLVRSQLAHSVRAEYLRLTAQMYPLFQQFMAFSTSGQPDNDVAEIARLRQDMEATLDRIRALIAREVAHTGNREDEEEELNLLARIERQLQAILSRFAAARQLKATGKQEEARLQIAEIMEHNVNRDFRTLLDEALEEETREVEHTDQASNAVLRQLHYALSASLAAAILLGLGSILLLRRRLHQPLENLMQGTQALTRGDFNYRMPVQGRDEFAHIATLFNQMAEEIEQHRLRLERSHKSLEQRVSERTRQLHLANEALSRVDQTRRQFFADISHELRTPLTVIRGETQFALRGVDKAPEAYKDALQRILQQAEQLSRLVDDLLFIARSDAGTTRLERRAVALDQLVRQVCLDAQTLAHAKGITIAFQSDLTEAVVSGDQGRLRQLFLILLDNAVRYSQPASQIAVFMHPTPHGVSVQVRDTGMGIPPEDVERIFERFYRGDQAATLHSDGLGLGLPVAKAIVEAHDGEMTVDSRLDQGTIIAVTLPTTRKLRVAA
jgi:signal transduction histidine kinase